MLVALTDYISISKKLSHYCVFSVIEEQTLNTASITTSLHRENVQFLRKERVPWLTRDRGGCLVALPLAA